MAFAGQERRRLGLGHNPISDISDLINGQGIWASGAILPDQMSGLFVRHASIGLCVLVNYDHARSRKRFSYAHEYAHAILDREQTATVSLEQNRSDLSEVRANAFASAFLIPRTGVWAFLNGRAKAGPSVVEQTVYDPTAEQDGAEVRGHGRPDHRHHGHQRLDQFSGHRPCGAVADAIKLDWEQNHRFRLPFGSFVERLGP